MNTFEEKGYQLVNGYAKPLSFVYRDNIVVEPTTSKSILPTTHYLEHMEYPEYEGIQLYLNDVDNPFIGLIPDPIDWFFLNTAKRLLMESLKVFKTWQFMIAFIFTWKKTKYIEKLIESYNSINFKGMEHLFLKYEHMTPVAYELYHAIDNFIVNMGIDETISNNFADIISHLIEYDNAYRWRIQDIMSETSIEKLLKDPAKEVDRLALIMSKRDSPGVYEKFKSVKYVISALLLLPKFKKAFRNTVEKINLSKLQYSEADKYWVSTMEDYQYMGKTNEERKQMYE